MTAKKTPVPDDHKEYLAVDFYPLCHQSGSLSDEERKLLLRYGTWMEALVSRKIRPATPSQERFILVHHRYKSPTTKYEVAWMKLIDQREKEVKEGLRKSILNCDNVDTGPQGAEEKPKEGSLASWWYDEDFAFNYWEIYH